jgi:uncharacterized spore protein YtfJ
MDRHDVLSQARDAITVRRVFGEPYEKDGVTVIAAASVRGGAGGGGGESPADQASGSGGGFGLSARPVGMYVIRGDAVTWEPALDVTRIAIGGQILGAVALLTIRSIVRSRRKGRG